MNPQLEPLEAVLSKASGAVQYIPGVSELENFYSAIGLGSGPFAPLGRGVVTFGAVLALQKAVSPSIIYDAQGQVRPWRYDPLNGPTNAGDIDPDLENQTPADVTSVPWWLIPGLSASFAMLFL